MSTSPFAYAPAPESVRPALKASYGLFIGGKFPLQHGPAEGEEGLHKNIAKLAQMRERVGPDFWLMADCWMSLDLNYATRLANAAHAHGHRSGSLHATAQIFHSGEDHIAVGHTDSVGSDAYNQRLSLARAESVKAYLVSQGIPAARIKTEGKGESQPVADNASADGRAKNRRVEIDVVAGPAAK